MRAAPHNLYSAPPAGESRQARSVHTARSVRASSKMIFKERLSERGPTRPVPSDRGTASCTNFVHELVFVFVQGRPLDLGA